MLSSNAPSKKRRKYRLDFYLIALFATLPFSVVLFVYLASTGAAELFLSDWFLWLVSIPAFFAYQFSAAAYFGRAMDLGLAIKNKFKNRKGEFAGTLFGIVLGIGFGVALSVLTPIPLTASLFAFAGVLFTLRQISIFGGLGNRLGKCLDHVSRPIPEKRLVTAASIFGLILSIILLATCMASMVSVVGVTFFFSGSALIPAGVATIIFMLTLASGFASAADYIGKSFSFLRYLSYLFKKKNMWDHSKQSQGFTIDFVRARPWEYGLAGCGMSLGLIIGIAIAVAVIAPNPALSGIVGVIAGMLVVLVCISIFGSLLSRLGRIVDGLRPQPSPGASVGGGPPGPGGPGPGQNPNPSPSTPPFTPLMQKPVTPIPDNTPLATPASPPRPVNKTGSSKNYFFGDNWTVRVMKQGDRNDRKPPTLQEKGNSPPLRGSRLRNMFSACHPQ